MRIAVKDVRPEQCAGPFIQSPADLFTKLWVERYAPVTALTDKIGLDMVMALLVERDGQSMPPASLATSVRYIWISVWSNARAYRAALTEKNALLAEERAARTATRDQRKAQMQVAREQKVKNRARIREAGEDIASQCRPAIHYYMEFPLHDRDQMAKFVASRLNVSVSTVKKYSGGTKAAAKEAFDVRQRTRR